MGAVFAELDDKLRSWIDRQPLFFVGTAPSGSTGHVNVSPKGGRGTLAILGGHEIAYVDLFGSGIETVAHLKQNGRIVLMFCAFEGAPRILRIHGRGEVVEMGDSRFEALLRHFELTPDLLPTVRSVIRVAIQRIADSCGYVVPEMSYRRERRALVKTAQAWIDERGDDAIRTYCDVNNGASIDGLPGLTPFGSQPDDEERVRLSHLGRRL
jgi:hypothetical protein